MPQHAAPGAPVGLVQAPGTLVAQAPPGVQVVVLDASGQQQTVYMQQPQLAGMGVAVPAAPVQLQQQPPPPPPPQQQQLVLQPLAPQPQQQLPAAPGSGGAAALLGQDAAATKALLRQVAAMDDATIDKMEPATRDKLKFVKRQIELGVVKVE
jgi:hypothetical protein